MDLSPGIRSTPVTARAGDTAIRSATRITFNYSNLTGFEALWYLKAEHDVPLMIPPHTVRLEFNSAFDMLDFVQVVSDHVGKMAGLDEDQLHWVSVAVRESVVNAIKHGNKNDSSKRVLVEFSPVPPTAAGELVIRIEDQGEGFVPEEVADPLAPENILKSSGRGIFLIRNFMDETVLKRVPGGMEIRMVKKIAKAAN